MHNANTGHNKLHLLDKSVKKVDLASVKSALMKLDELSLSFIDDSFDVWVFILTIFNSKMLIEVVRVLKSRYTSILRRSSAIEANETWESDKLMNP